jgi:hypothetical protein
MSPPVFSIERALWHDLRYSLTDIVLPLGSYTYTHADRVVSSNLGNLGNYRKMVGKINWIECVLS